MKSFGLWGNPSGRPDDIAMHKGCGTRESTMTDEASRSETDFSAISAPFDLSRGFSSMQQWSVALAQKLRSILQIRQTARARDGNTTSRSPTSLQRRLVRPDPARQLTSRRADIQRRVVPPRLGSSTPNPTNPRHEPKPASRLDQAPLTWKSRTASDASAPGPAPRPSRG